MKKQKEEEVFIKLIRAFFILLILTVFISASSIAIKNPFLWHVSKGKTEFYLFGTMHLADPVFQKLPVQLETVLKRSDAVYTEISMDPSVQMESTKLMIRDDGRTLRSTLPASLYDRSGTYLRSIDRSLTMKPFERMKLWAFSATLQFLEAQLNNPSSLAIDGTLYQDAKLEGKEVGGIESIEEQLAAFEALSDEEQVLMHEATLDYLEQNKDYTKIMRELYLGGDEKALMQYLTSMMFQEERYRALEERFMQLLLYERNKRMAQRIIQKITDNPDKIYLFAFGAMHFLDKGSVIELLQKEGFKVERIKER